ncbi:phage tail protein [Zooshikella ganghwensis]|uniref:phage tail protein n=1 Tax=Zooshikella ganghwensis TaxID=202772 RepID=UPI000417D187|nr:phage tail protein [Zooshikella ganghwensis]
MTKQYYNLLTKTGKSKLTNAALLGGALKLTKIKVGDGGADEGKETFPSESTTRLVRERWAGNLTNLYIDPHNKNWVVAEAIIPVDVGGFYVTEFGLYDEQGDLICIGKYPSTYKPLIPQGNGTANSLFLKVILQVANASNIDLKVDLSIAMASREYVDENFVSKSGGIFYGDIGVAGEIYTGINYDKRVYHEGHKPTKFDVGLGNLPNVKSDAISDNSSDKLATVKAVKTINDKVNKHQNSADPHSQYLNKADQATDEELAMGEVDGKYISPKKLRFGFSVSLKQNGFITFPSWLGGIIFQWGKVDFIVKGNTHLQIARFPIRFSKEVFSVIVSGYNADTMSEGVEMNIGVKSYTTESVNSLTGKPLV